MPPVSKKQARFMRAVASGKLKKPGLSADEAEEFVSGYPTKGLPETKAKRAVAHTLEDREVAKYGAVEAPAGRRIQRGRQMRKARKAATKA